MVEGGGQRARLAPGRDYPASYQQFRRWFADEAGAAWFLEQLRWPAGFVCPRCGAAQAPWRQSRGRLTCAACRHQTSVTAGTVLDRTRTPLTVWLDAAWQMTTAKNGLSAVTLARTLDVRYRVAWTMLQRLRVAMVRAERAPLAGEVEVDETFVGGVRHGAKRGRGAQKCVVVIALEVKQPKGFGRVRMRHVANASGDELVPFVCDVVAPGSALLTDGWGGYNDLPDHGYTRHKTVLSSSGNPAHVSMPGVHRVASLLKRWLLGTHQGSVDPAHLQSYLEEYTFRFNRRTSRSRGLVFRRLLEQAVTTGPVTEAELAGGYPWRPQDVAPEE